MLLALAMLLAALALAAEAQRREERRAVLESLEGAGLAPWRVARERQRAERWDEPSRMRLEIARRLVNQALAPDPDAPAGEAAVALPLAHRLAAEAFAARPGDWRGPALLGSSLYLQRSLAADPRVVTEASLWEAPLVHARQLAPEAEEPGRFQAIAFLELWPYLPEDRRREARALLRGAFEHGPTFRRLLAPWLETARDREEALSVIPDQSAAWQHLQRELAPRTGFPGDAATRLEALERWRDALAKELEEELEVARRERPRDPYQARRTYLGIVARAPTEARFVPSVERALAEAPPGPALAAYDADVERWLDWTLALDLVGAPRLSAAAVDRLAAQAVNLPPPRAAHAAVATGDLPEGERLERRTFDGRDPAWGAYLVAKARDLVRRDRGEEALATLDRLPPSWRERPSALAARLAAARRAKRWTEAEEAAEALRRIADGPAVVWLPGDPPRGELVVAEEADSLLVEGRGTPPGRESTVTSTLVDVRLDGRRVAGRRLRGSDDPAPGRAVTAQVRDVPLPPPAVGVEADGPGPTPPDPRLHLLEVVPVDGGGFEPLRVRIRNAG